MIWPFPTRGARGYEIPDKPTNLPQSAAFERSDARVKVWLPKSLVDRIDWISHSQDASRQDVVRALLFKHLYGELAYSELLRVKQRSRADEVVHSALALSRDASAEHFPYPSSDTKQSVGRDNPASVEMFGYAHENLAWHIPQRMKDDLLSQARLEKLPPSELVRKILVLQLFGGVVHATWRAMIGNVGEDVLRIEQE